MKILLVARWPVGGIKTYFKYIYGSSAFAGVSITLLAPDDGLADYLNTQFPPGRIKLITTKPDRKSFVSAIKQCLKGETFDVVHSHGFSASLYAQQVLFFTKIPHVLTAHDVFLPNTFIGFNGWMKKLAMRWLLGSVDKVLSVSEDARNNILEYFPSLKPAQVLNITNGVNTLYFKNGTARNLQQELNIGDRKIIGFFGRFMAQKGFNQLVKAVDYIISNKLIEQPPLVLTFGWGGFVREEFAAIEEKGLAEYFMQLPGTDDMPAAIKGVDLVVMPSRWEACPLLPMEVLSCGVPIIGTSCVGLREVLAETPAKVVPVGDYQTLAAAIVAQLTEGPADFEAYQQSAVKRFSSEGHADTLYKFYTTLIASNAK